MRAGERGSMSVFTVLFSVVVFLLAGLLVDGGSAINARLRAADVAEQAARAGADELDVDHLRETGRRGCSARRRCAPGPTRSWPPRAATT
ncbi:Tad domain-containing protein [Nonomuraea rubra]|uniref:Tad domain-containing protein n=1 Tax=Nonomuraea rubra TaxID=46180 RepID=UPI00361DA8AA